ncbi:hypothetical protein E2C01_064436 [Portunus trituberculatus]|uniref:Uncharacterized protein n=1 Tax=Portunus trituberculatus TaxID=210409 RepID=A0A5B7HNR7_PORTR|nr:hypothetical protein [Portunus trituberculatus]
MDLLPGSLPPSPFFTPTSPSRPFSLSLFLSSSHYPLSPILLPPLHPRLSPHCTPLSLTLSLTVPLSTSGLSTRCTLPGVAKIPNQGPISSVSCQGEFPQPACHSPPQTRLSLAASPPHDLH